MFVNQNSVNGDRNDAYRNVAACQSYCITLRMCVAVDFTSADNTCWVHTNAADLNDANTYSQAGTTQYRLDRSCDTTS